MPYPVTLTPAYDAGDSPTGVYGFSYNGNVYKFLVDSQSSIAGASTTFGYLHCHKSTDLGQTWSEVDAANAPRTRSLVSNTGFPKFTAAKFGSTIQLIWVRESNPGTRQIDGLTSCTFDLSAELWGSPANFSAPSIDYTQSTRCVIALAARGANDYILFYSSTRSAGAGRVSYSTFDGSTLGSAVSLPSQSGATVYHVNGVIHDSANSIILFTYSGGNGNVFSVGLNNSNTFGSVTTHTTNNAYNSPYNTSSPIVFDVSSTKYFGFATYLSEATDRIRFFRAPVALNPSWTSAIVASGFDGDDILPANATSVYLARSMGVAYSANSKIGLIGIAASNNSENSADRNQYYQYSSALAVSWTTWRPGVSPYHWAFAGNTSTDGGATWGTAAQLFDNPNPAGLTGVQSYQIVTFDADPPAGTLAVTENVSDSMSLTDSLNSLGSEGSGVSLNTASNATVFSPSCVFEFYGLERPESVEVLPVPKKFDQVFGRFDKIGKIFGFRIRLIQNGSTTQMPFSVYSDESPTSLRNSAPLYSSSFVVVPGRDGVYEIKFPKNINTDVIRLTFGPVEDSFHRYDVLLKVQSSGMESESKWIPIR